MRGMTVKMRRQPAAVGIKKQVDEYTHALSVLSIASNNSLPRNEK